MFNVLGDVFPANQLERMLREMYARNLTDQVNVVGEREPRGLFPEWFWARGPESPDPLEADGQ